MLDRLRNLWGWVDSLGSSVKTLIIIVLVTISVPSYVDSRIGIFRNRYGDCYEHYKMMAERYALTTAPLIDTEVKGILLSDPEIQNVILVNYHNTKTNLSGYSYLYLSAITEGAKDVEWRGEWKELDYVYYSTELERIKNRGYLRVDSLVQMKHDFPRLLKKVEFCDAKSVAFYPIAGVNRPIGMLIVLYNDTKKYHLGYYQEVIAPHIVKLASLLDYSNITNEIMDNDESRQK